MFVLGTAGHIDHGKSVLVQALTGIDPDRLREEKERGMTIDLGFAWLTLPSGQEVGIVDVPGHEHFIKNMLAGIGGIDLALLVVAANEGVMPQTREHLAILDLLKIEKVIMVITKRDLVDDEWLDLVQAEVKQLIAPSALARAPIATVSAVTGEGLSELVSVIDELLSSTGPKKDIGRPRLSIDRVFTIAGSGTVVTGTLIDGLLTVGQETEIVPSNLRSRLRGIQTHKTHLNTATPGSRVAANLVGVAKSAIQRGGVLTKPGWLMPTRLITVELCLLPYLRHPLRHNAEVNFHVGTSETMAKVKLLESDKLQPGETGWVQLSLDKPVASVKGDHFVIRSAMETLGGGEIIESHVRRYRRFRPHIVQSLNEKKLGTPEEVVIATLEASQPLEFMALMAQSELSADEVQAAIESLIEREEVIMLGQREHSLLMTTSGWENITDGVISILQDYHRKFKARLGMPKAELSSRLKLGELSSALFGRLSEKGRIVEEGSIIRLCTHRVQLTLGQQAKISSFLQALEQDPYSPPGDLIPEPDLLNLLIDRHQVVKVSDGVVFPIAAYNEMVAGITSHLKIKGKVTLAEARNMFNTSRKYALALLEYLDRRKVTRRVGDARVPYQKRDI